MAPHRDLLLSESKTKILRRQLKRRMLEFIRQVDAYGIDIVISFDIENANADQLERTMNDLEMIDATVENEPC